MQQSMIPGNSQGCHQQEFHLHRENRVWEISQWEQARYKHTEQINHTTMTSQM